MKQSVKSAKLQHFPPLLKKCLGKQFGGKDDQNDGGTGAGHHRVS